MAAKSSKAYPRAAVVQLKPVTVRIGALAFHDYAYEFLRAAHAYRHKRRYSPVPYFLLCRSIELALKAYLLLKGETKRNLKEKFGHDLGKILRQVRVRGLDRHVRIMPQHEVAVASANRYYKAKGFEYFEVTNALLGYPDLPSLSDLDNLASALVTQLEAPCRDAT